MPLLNRQQEQSDEPLITLARVMSWVVVRLLVPRSGHVGIRCSRQLGVKPAGISSVVWGSGGASAVAVCRGKEHRLWAEEGLDRPRCWRRLYSNGFHLLVTLDSDIPVHVVKARPP